MAGGKGLQAVLALAPAINNAADRLIQLTDQQLHNLGYANDINGRSNFTRVLADKVSAAYGGKINVAILDSRLPNEHRFDHILENFNVQMGQGGSYYVTVFTGPGFLNNSGDGGWHNWCCKGNLKRTGEKSITFGYVDYGSWRIALLSAAHDKYLRANPDGTKFDGAPHPSDWEVFKLYDLGGDRRAIWSVASRRFICVPPGNGDLTADRELNGAWESFRLKKMGDNKYALMSHDGHYLCMERDGRVVCNRPAVGPWEEWYIIYLQ